MNTIEDEIRRYATDVVGAPRGPIPSEPERGGITGRGPWLIAAICLVVLVGMGAAIALRPGQTSKAPTSETPSTETPSTALLPESMVGRSAPELTGTTVDGSTVTLSSMRGSWVVVDISATWCVPCQIQLPELVELSHVRPDVKILTVAFDDDLSQLTAMYTSGGGATWPVVSVGYVDLLAFRVTGVPTSYVIGPDGTITDMFEGATHAQLESATSDPSTPVTTGGPPLVQPDDEAWRSNVVDHAGRIRGKVQADSVALPGGFHGQPVIDSTGALTGYLVQGDLGFVGLDQATNADTLQLLTDCMATLSTTHTASTECAQALSTIGLEIHPTN